MIILKIHRVVVLSIIYIHVKIGNCNSYDKLLLILNPLFINICSNIENKKYPLIKKKFISVVCIIICTNNTSLVWDIKISFFLYFIDDKDIIIIVGMSARLKKYRLIKKEENSLILICELFNEIVDKLIINITSKPIIFFILWLRKIIVCWLITLENNTTFSSTNDHHYTI